MMAGSPETGQCDEAPVAAHIEPKKAAMPGVEPENADKMAKTNQLHQQPNTGNANGYAILCDLEADIMCIWQQCPIINSW
jgi:hypothetical protein